MSLSRQSKDKYLPLALLLLLFLAFRIPILFSSIGSLVFNQELCIGTLAKALTADARLPVFECLDPYRWGGTVTGMLAVPFYALLGDTLLALRSMMLCISLGTLVVFYLFLYEFFNKTTAVIASLLFILAPSHSIRMSYLATGSYAELNLFVLSAVFVFYKIFFRRRERRPASLYALLGFLCGFGLFYDYPFLLTIACCVLFWFVLDRKFLLRKQFYIFLGSFLVGFSPWFWYNITYRWNAVFIIHGSSLWQVFTGNSPG